MRKKVRVYTYQCQVCRDVFVRTKPRKTNKCMACDTGWIRRIK
jgi:hypothetical protein